jgi:predicted nucleic acid-binding protein
LILADTSGLFAALVANQRTHAGAKAALAEADHPILLSPFILAELDYFLARQAGVDAELAFLSEVSAGAYDLVTFDSVDVREAETVIHKYADLGIGLADASLVVLAGRYRTNRILTLDERHFRALRTPAGEPFVVLPADG